MQLPFNPEDVRLISIDGDTVKFVLQHGYIELKLESRTSDLTTPSRTEPNHLFFQDGIYGI